MAKVSWSDDAVRHLIEIAAYVIQFDPVAADEVGAALRALGGSLVDFPNRGRPTADGHREMVNVWPYILKYEVQGDRAFIRSIRHSARDVR